MTAKGARKLSQDGERGGSVDTVRGTACWRCRGDGYFWRVPNGFNPFRAGGWATARASWRVDCYECRDARERNQSRRLS